MEYDDRPPVCGGCLTAHSLVPIPARMNGREVASAPRRRAGVVAASDLRPRDTRAPYGQPFDAWQIGDPHAVVLVGPPGGGKSTLATRMAVSAARRVEVLYLAVEEGHAATLAARLERAGLDDLGARRLRVSDARQLAEVDEDVAASKAAIVIVDSLTELGGKPETITTMLLGRSWIGVQHVNSYGGPKGGLDFAHAADVVVEVIDGRAKPSKNRFGPMTVLRAWE